MKRTRLRKRRLRFKGWDWTELLELFPKRKWPKDEHGFDSETAKAEWLREALLEVVPMDGSGKSPVANEVRRFLKKAGAVSHHYDGGIYLAIANCEHDWTMIQWVARNLECIWT